jgi:ribosome-binding protein aMBF1 (putative translation factor)
MEMWVRGRRFRLGRHGPKFGIIYSTDIRRKTQQHRELEDSRRKHVQPTSGLECTFGHALRGFRKARRLSQEKLAAGAGLDRSYISLLQRGLSSPTLKALWQIADVLEVRPAEMIERVQEVAPPGNNPQGRQRRTR